MSLALNNWAQIFVLDMSSMSHCGLSIVPGQEANGDNLGKSF